MKKIAEDKESKFWKIIHDMHLYDIKGEGLFKAILITFSWIGGVNMETLPETISVSIATSLFLFSAALIMEYTIRLVVTEKVATKILPLIVVGISFVCGSATFGELVNRPLKIVLEYLYNMTIIPQCIIWFDVILQLMLNKPNDKKIETILKKVEVS